jgi:hypothetical protein
MKQNVKEEIKNKIQLRKWSKTKKNDNQKNYYQIWYKN